MSRRFGSPTGARKNNFTKPLLAALLALLLGACAHTGGPGEAGNVDPIEPFNRAMFKFNDKVDRAVVKPLAKGYKKVVPAGIRKRVGNFFFNLGEPTTIINDVLQGKLPQAGHDFSRFAINTTIGVLGFFDVGTQIGLERHKEDFGQTFSVWGIARGPYLVLPLWGPSTLTDGIGLIPAVLYTDPRTAIQDAETTYILIGTSAVDARARLLGASKLAELQLDRYIFLRETYLQRRLQLVHDGDPPLDDAWE
ncbi:MAG: putative phospholipid-binding lipoprotein MlaA [Gammaproteobacteria bacterium]|nr:putative phospholipid-binding lipoprotein MlaA [Gammaproteobacteria bacterium]